jgi:hypothetical protein
VPPCRPDSRVEGTQSSLSDLVLFEAEANRTDARENVGEVFNYVQAVGHVLDPDRRLPLSVSCCARPTPSC